MAAIFTRTLFIYQLHQLCPWTLAHRGAAIRRRGARLGVYEQTSDLMHILGELLVVIKFNDVIEFPSRVTRADLHLKFAMPEYRMTRFAECRHSRLPDSPPRTLTNSGPCDSEAFTPVDTGAFIHRWSRPCLAGALQST